MNNTVKSTIRIVDLFAGLGGIRLGFTQAFEEKGYLVDCVFTSEIKPHAIRTLQQNFPDEQILGDITAIDPKTIPDFDYLLAGFPCQPFSYAGKREGFADTRGTLFFTIEEILRTKQPQGFILENVEGLVKHDLADPKDSIGRTLTTILNKLETLGYHTTYKVLDSQDFGLPQSRKRIYIVGTKTNKISLEDFSQHTAKIESVLEKNQPTLDTPFTQKLLAKYPVHELYGKAIKDKRGGTNNIHSWDLELRGAVSVEQKIILTKLFKERRKKHWAISKGIVWTDGMPLTLKEISTFCDNDNLKELLDDLVTKGYLVVEHPKNLKKHTTPTGEELYQRKPDSTVPQGYNIVTGKLSFEFSHILNPESVSQTLVASDMIKIGVIDNNGIRRLTTREGLRFFGFPETYQICETMPKTYDLLGNSVTVPVVRAVAERLLLKCQ